MPGLLEGKVALVSGAARGQGRSHCVKLAEEGADIIAFDLCADIDVIPYPLATPEDLEETVSLVEKLDRRIVATQTDIRDTQAVRAAVDDGVAKLGRLDIVVANAGIVSFMPAQDMDEESWLTMIDTNLSGTWRTVHASLRHMLDGGNGGSIILTSSAAAVMGLANLTHYSASKGGILGLMRCLSVELAPHSIRVNAIIPTAVSTPMTHNQATYSLFAGQSLDDVKRDPSLLPPMEDIEAAYKTLNALPVPWVEAEDISNAVLFLASDNGRFVTGSEFRVDAGSINK